MFGLIFDILTFIGNKLIQIAEDSAKFTALKAKKIFKDLKKIFIFKKKKPAKTPTKALSKKKMKVIKQVPKEDPKQTPKFKHRLITFLKYLFVFLLGSFSTLLFAVLPFELYRWYGELPNPEMLVTEASSKTTKILDRKGRLLYEIYVDKQYEPVKLNQIPKTLIQATIAVEDERFYYHQGVSPLGMIRAARETLIRGRVQGGSTITQQLIKNVLLSQEQTISRKLKEIALAFIVESKYSKDQILELYLNNISYGGTSWGVQSASQKYFGKNVWELSLAESALLSGLPSAPSTYSPLSNFEYSKSRQKYVLDRMVEVNYINASEAAAAYDEELVFADQIEYIRAPHFVDLVRKELETRYGKRYVDFGGLTVTTTLDLDLQNEVQAIVAEEVEKSLNINISNGAAVVLDVKNANILAYVGSINYFKDTWGAFDVASAERQPGSSIKPVTYALAFSDSFTPASIIEDSEVVYNVKGSPPYKPQNYDSRYHGKVTLRQALANSYNIPAVKLASALGPRNIVQLGIDMGLRTWDVDGAYGLSVTLGGEEVKLLDLVNTYATFGRKGEYLEVSPFLSIRDGRGFDIYSPQYRERKQVLSEGVAYLIWHILSDNNARLPAFGTRNFLSIPDYKIAAKTGTTDSKRDNWTLGFTPSYAVGVWVGNNNNDPMNNRLASGLSGAAPMWNRIFTVVLEGKGNEIFEMPDEVFVKEDQKCSRSEVFIKGGKIPVTLCPPEKKDKDKDDD